MAKISFEQYGYKLDPEIEKHFSEFGTVVSLFKNKKLENIILINNSY